MKEFKSFIRSTGMYLPEKVMTNMELSKMMDTSDEWIIQRSGIKERRYAEIGVMTSDLAAKATQNMLAKGEVKEEEIDCIIFGTTSPDYLFPGTGVFLQNKLGWHERRIPCFDIRQQCSNFVYGLQMAQAFVETGMYSNVLLIGAEVHSHGLDFSTRGRAITVLFGDGAACAVISRKTDNDSKSEILSSEVWADGSGALNGIHMKLFDISQIPIINYNPLDPEKNADFYPDMPSPKNLFANAVRRMTETSTSVLNKAGLNVNEIDYLLPHQANIRINSMVAEYLKIKAEKVLYNIQKYGNTTSATIPLLLAENVANGVIKRGDLLLMVGFGSGFTWGSVLVRY